MTGAGIAPADAAEIRQVIQGHFVQPDVFCPHARQDRLRHLLGDRLEYHLHPGVGHGLRSVFRNTLEGRLTWQQQGLLCCPLKKALMGIPLGNAGSTRLTPLVSQVRIGP